MLVTEAVAHKKMCCNDLSLSCQGQLCMAWRWAEPVPKEFVGDNTNKIREAPENRKGYCGRSIFLNGLSYE